MFRLGWLCRNVDKQVDLVGDYVKRGPTAVIVPVDVPILCNEPVTFRAASSDMDQQSLEHFWWVLGAYMDSGTTIEVVLTNGSHNLALFSQDPDGRFDVEEITYTRVCR